MTSRILSAALTTLILAVSAAAQTQDRAFLNQYCAGCHNEKAKTGGLALEKLDLNQVGDQAETWEKLFASCARA